MHQRAVWVAKAIAIVGVIVAPLAIHAAIATTSWTPLIVLVPIVQLTIFGVALLTRRGAWVKWLALPTAVLTGGLIWAYEAGLNLAAAPGIPHALAYLGLLVGFGASLLPGHVPLLTRVVVSVRGPLPHELMSYTRHVTWAWCIFFAAQLAASLALFVWAPIEVWSFFINVLNFPLVLLVFGIEYLYRVTQFRDYPHDNFSDIMRIFRKAVEHARQADSV